MVTRPENYAPLHQNGRIYQLDRDLSKLPIEGRPLSQQTAPAELARRRAPLYESFRDFLVDNNGTVRKTAEMIWRDFNENDGD